jgi:hypothetical protein
MGKKKKRRGSLRARSWIYGALNPLVAALERERGRLEAGRFGWSLATRRLDGICAPAGYLPPEGQVVLEDLARAVEEGGELSDRLRRHGERVLQVEAAAGAWHAALSADATFEGWVREALGRYRAQKLSPEEPWGARGEGDLPALVAARIVAGESELPPHAPEARLMSLCGEMRQAVEARPSRAQLELVRASAQAAIDDGLELQGWLKELRFTLCERFDVPAAPVPGVA